MSKGHPGGSPLLTLPAEGHAHLLPVCFLPAQPQGQLRKPKPKSSCRHGKPRGSFVPHFSAYCHHTGTCGPGCDTVSTLLDVTPEWVPALAKEEPRAKSTLGVLALPEAPEADPCSPQHTFWGACSPDASFRSRAQPSIAELPVWPRSPALLQPATAARNASLGEGASTFHYRHTTDCRVLVQIIIQSYPRADP